jgi:dihydroflavonol-4-reductase
MKAVVTGANGLIGANLVRALLAAGHQVRGLVRPTSNLASLADLAIDMARGDVVVGEGLDDAFANAEAVFHTAAHFAYWGVSDAALEETAVAGTRHVLVAAARAGVRRVVLTSSSVVLGSSATPQPRDERDTLGEEDDEPAYVHAKAKQEREAFVQARELGLELVAVCPTMSVGPHALALGPSNAVITTYLRDALRLTYPGGCNIVSVGDVAQGHILAAEAGVPGERYVLGSENLEWARIHGLIAELSGVPAPHLTANRTGCYVAALTEEFLARLNDRAPSTSRVQAKMVGRYYWYSHAKAATLGYKPRPARQALAEAIAWLAASRHVSRETRATLLLSRDVYAARREFTRAEASLRGAV